jgi:tellurite resistance protein TehA-like permease
MADALADTSTLRARLRESIRTLPPAYFAMAMATGIVSIAALIHSYDTVARLLFVLNLCTYGVLAVIYLLRALWFPRVVLDDLVDHQRGPGFFTTVAASCIVGSQFVLVAGNDRMGMVFLAVAVALWLGLMYSIFTAFTIKEEKPALADGLNGAWLIAVVATQAIAVLTALLSPRWGGEASRIANFLATSMWLFGGMLYIWMIALIFYRYTFFRFSPSDLTPPYWINMGAMAIATLAGTRLMLNASDDPLLASMLPFIKGFTILFWATGTWWIPMLLILGVWRHVVKRTPLRYHPLYWGAVFPLGMYSVCTALLGRTLEVGFLGTIAAIFLVVAGAAWLAAFLGWLVSSRSLLRATPG